MFNPSPSQVLSRRFAAALLRLFSRPAAWTGLACLIFAVGAGIQAANPPASSHAWAPVNTLGTAYAFGTPALLPDWTAVIWNPRAAVTPLRYTSLDRTHISTSILPYVDVMPRRWYAAPAGPDTYHIIWLEADDRLRCALIDSAGQTQRGPVDLSPRAREEVITLSDQDGTLLVIWMDARTSRRMITGIDRSGRPRAASVLWGEPSALVAAGLDRQGILHLAWLAPDARTITYQTTDYPGLNTGEPVYLHTPDLATDEIPTGLHMGLDLTHAYLFLSTTLSDQPQFERIYSISFPLGQPDAATLSELKLPRRADFRANLIAVAAASDHQVASLRWPRPAPGQHAVGSLALALRTLEGWRPAVVFYRDGNPLGFQIAADLPSDAAPPVLMADASGDLWLAWLGLHNTVPVLYTTTTAAQEAHGSATIGYIARQGIARLLMGVFWLILPAYLLILWPLSAWTLTIAAAVYMLGKLIWPPALFAAIPPLLAIAGLDRFQPAFAVGAATLFIALIAVAFMTLALRFKRSPWQAWLIYVVVDMLLTWSMFGANVHSL